LSPSTDPYPILAELREAAPVRQVELLGLRAWLVTRYSDVLEAFRHPSISSDARYANPATQAWPQVAASLRGPLARSVAMIDDPDHARLRRLISQEFTPRRVEELRPRITDVCDRCGCGPSDSSAHAAALSRPMCGDL
jgi:cytochrome P450